MKDKEQKPQTDKEQNKIAYDIEQDKLLYKEKPQTASLSEKETGRVFSNNQGERFVEVDDGEKKYIKKIFNLSDGIAEICGMEVLATNKVREFIKEIDEWCEKIGRTTLITAETFMKVLKDKAGEKLL